MYCTFRIARQSHSRSAIAHQSTKVQSILEALAHLPGCDEVRDARRHAGSMRVVGVSTFDDALLALGRSGITGTAATAK